MLGGDLRRYFAPKGNGAKKNSPNKNATKKSPPRTRKRSPKKKPMGSPNKSPNESPKEAKPAEVIKSVPKKAKSSPKKSPKQSKPTEVRESVLKKRSRQETDIPSIPSEEPAKKRVKKTTPPKTKRVSRKPHPGLEITPNEKKKKEKKFIVYGDDDMIIDVDAEEKKAKEAPAPAKPVYTPTAHAFGRSTTPLNKGSKEIPIGKDFCLFGKVFIITGVLDSLERDDADKLIKKYGGKVVKSAKAKSLTHILCGTEPGAAKLQTAEERNLPLLSEDDLFELIKTSSAKKLSIKEKEKIEKQAIPQAKLVKAAKVTKATRSPLSSDKTHRNTSSNALWTTLYHPTSSKELVGNPSSIKKLREWLSQWGKGKKQSDKAALLSGPPGIGKTSSAMIIAKELGYEVIEFNASDTRSKKALDRHISELMGNRTISTMFAKNKNTKSNGKSVLIMDEVDGMSGSDRGGVAMLIQLIKTTKIPLICICNDKNSTKIRSLRNYCLELPFREVTAKQVAGRLVGIARSENLQLDGETVFKIATVANGDIRQMLNMMQMWNITNKHMSTEEANALTSKESSVGLFNIIPQLMTKESYAKATLNEKMQLYYTDSGLVPLFVQDNYITTHPFKVAVQNSVSKKRSLHMKLLSAAAESISDSDLFDAEIRSSQSWSLMPVHAVLSTIKPSYLVQGTCSGRQNFPAWLGKNSTAGKNQRLLADVRNHMQASVFASTKEVRLEYLPRLKGPLSTPLRTLPPAEAVDQVIEVMDAYHITREDWTSLFDICQFTNLPNPIASIPTATKSKFTREYNKRHKTVSSIPTSSKKKKAATAALPADADPEEISDEESEGASDDSLIKEKKAKKAPKKKKK